MSAQRAESGFTEGIHWKALGAGVGWFQSPQGTVKPQGWTQREPCALGLQGVAGVTRLAEAQGGVLACGPAPHHPRLSEATQGLQIGMGRAGLVWSGKVVPPASKAS